MSGEEEEALNGERGRMQHQTVMCIHVGWVGSHSTRIMRMLRNEVKTQHPRRSEPEGSRQWRQCIHVYVQPNTCTYMYIHCMTLCENAWQDNTRSRIPLCLVAISSARAWSLPPAGWATAATNSCQEGCPKRVVLYAFFSHSVSTSSRRLFTSKWSAAIPLRRSGCSLRALPTPLQLCATLSSS